MIEMSQFITFTVVTTAAYASKAAPRQLDDFNGPNISFASALDQ